MDDVKKFIRNLSQQLTNGTTEPDFFEIVRRFEQHCPYRMKVGYAQTPEEEILRFSQIPYLNFPENTLRSIEESSQPGALALLSVYFFGLCGVNGPLPLEFTNIVFQRAYNHYDRSMMRFLDLINHRFLTLFYRAWAENEATTGFDRPKQNLPEEIMRGIAGCPDMKRNGNRNDDGEYAKISLSAYFTSGKRSSSGQKALLTDYFNLPLKIQEFIPDTYLIPETFRSLLGNRNTALLGVNIQIGKRFTSITKKINISWGRLIFSQYEQMLPGTNGFQHSCGQINSYMDKPIAYDFVFDIRTDTLPKSCQSRNVAQGRSIWLGKVRANHVTVRLESSRLYSDNQQKQKKHLHNIQKTNQTGAA